MAPYCFTVLTFQPSKYLLIWKKPISLNAIKSYLDFLYGARKWTTPLCLYLIMTLMNNPAYENKHTWGLEGLSTIYCSMWTGYAKVSNVRQLTHRKTLYVSYNKRQSHISFTPIEDCRKESENSSDSCTMNVYLNMRVVFHSLIVYTYC